VCPTRATLPAPSAHPKQTVWFHCVQAQTVKLAAAWVRLPLGALPWACKSSPDGVCRRASGELNKPPVPYARKAQSVVCGHRTQVKGQEREFVRGIPVAVIQPALDQVRSLIHAAANGSSAASHEATLVGSTVRMLDVELEPVLLSKAASFGLPERWTHALNVYDPVRRQVRRALAAVRTLNVSPPPPYTALGC
jgi:hypothetical protein